MARQNHQLSLLKSEGAASVGGGSSINTAANETFTWLCFAYAILFFVSPDKLQTAYIYMKVSLCHFLVSHHQPRYGPVKSFSEFKLNKGPKAARPPKAFMSKIMSSRSSQIVSGSSSVLYTLHDFDHSIVIDAIFFIHVGLSLWSKL